jgi:trimeric autotransporter adhesin
MSGSKLLYSLSFCVICVLNSNAQNVGIGTMAPINKLDIRSDGDTTSAVTVLGLISTISQRPVLQFSEFAPSTPESGMSIEYEGKDLFGSENRLHIRGVGGIRKYTFMSGGWMGIGETSPHEPLEIGGIGRIFIGDGGGDLRRGLLIDANEAGDYVRLHAFDYGEASNMDIFTPSSVGIGALPDSSAIFQVQSTSKGMLVPRMPSAFKDAIAGPATGLLIYQTDGDKGFWYFDGSKWISLNSSRLLTDADEDTKVQVEKNPDEDVIRFELDSTERWVMVGSRLEPKNSAGAVYIGENAGLNDSLIFGANVGIGSNALKANKKNVDLVAIGKNALRNNAWDSTNLFLATGNTAIGSAAMQDNTTGAFNTAVGSFSMRYNVNGLFNSALGAGAFFSNTSGSFNCAFGSNALRLNVGGKSNTAMGSGSLETNVNGDRNCAFGERALYVHASGSDNVAIGHNTLYSDTVGSRNIAIGRRALYNNMDRNDLVAVGDSALYYNGTNATQSFHSTGNTALGSKSLKNNTTGYSNTAMGFSALSANLTGKRNSAFGYKALSNNLEGLWNTGIGYQALDNNTTGDFNTAIGSGANTGSGNLSNATAVGANATVSASNSLVLGDGAKVGIGSNTPSEKLTVAGTNARLFVGDGDGSTKTGLIIDGDEPGEYVRIHAYDYDISSTMDINIPSQLLLGVWGGTTTYTLEVASGNAAKPGGGSWASTSDIRLKQDIKDYHPGLRDILKIRPVQYRYNEKSGYDTTEEHIGVIAQELQTIAPYMVNTFMKDDTEYLSVDNSAMTFMLINAVKELSKLNEQTQTQLSRIEKEYLQLKKYVLHSEAQARISSLESVNSELVAQNAQFSESLSQVKTLLLETFEQLVEVKDRLNALEPSSGK